MAAKESSSLVSLAAAAVVAVTGLIPAIWLMSSPIEEPGGEGVAVVEPTTTIPETTVVEPIATLKIDELDPAVVRVLQANGYAQHTGQASLDEELPAAVTQVLVDRGVVLTVVEESPVAEEG